MSISITPKVEKEKPDIVKWDIETKVCRIVEERESSTQDRSSKSIQRKTNKTYTPDHNLTAIVRVYKYTTLMATVGVLGGILKILRET